jgi:hypothetical protein
MNCPTCDAQMWNTEPGFKRCPNDHLFRIEEVVEPTTKVIRVDRPSARERLGDFVLGAAVGALASNAALAVSHYL